MEKAQILNTLKVVKENSNKRNFKQSIDLIINLKDLDMKKPESKVDLYVQLHFDRGKKVKICGLVGAELIEQAKKYFDAVILSDEFSKYNDKRKIKKLANEHTFFVAQANMMPQVATTFGRFLGPRGKMPNPKAGCVVPPNANLQPVAQKLQKTLRIKVDTSPVFQASVGIEDMDEAQVADNILIIYNALIHALPNDVQNFKEAYLKLTMGKAYKISGESAAQTEAKKQKAIKKAKTKAQQEKVE